MTRTASLNTIASAIIALLLALAFVMTSGAGPADAASAVRFTTGRFDSTGTDTRSNTSLNGEWVTLKNFGTAGVSLKGWTVRDAQSHVYTFGTFTLAAGRSVTVYTGKGTNSTSKRYWGSTAYIWNNTGDTAYLKNASGTTLDSCAGKGATVSC